MTKQQIKKLNNLLDALMQVAPCQGGGCVGHQNCDFCENGCYGETCAIEDVQNALPGIETTD